MLALPAGYLIAVMMRSGLGWLLPAAEGSRWWSSLALLLIVGVSALVGGFVVGLAWRGSGILIVGGVLGVVLFGLEVTTLLERVEPPAGFGGGAVPLAMAEPTTVVVLVGLVTCLAASGGALLGSRRHAEIGSHT